MGAWDQALQLGLWNKKECGPVWLALLAYFFPHSFLLHNPKRANL